MNLEIGRKYLLQRPEYEYGIPESDATEMLSAAGDPP